MITRRGLFALPALAAFAADRKERLIAQTYIFQQQNKAAAEVFATVKEAGFRAVELMPAFAGADSNGVEVEIAYSGGSMEDALAVAAKTGAKAVNYNPDPKPKRERKSDEELASQADRVNRVGRALRDRGQRLLLHHHDAEMADHAREWRYMLSSTDPALVGICVDCHWAWRGGQNYMDMVRAAGARLESLHLRNSVAGVWSESLGPGDVDYAPLEEYLRGSRLTPYLVVELAYESGTRVTRPLADNLRMSREYVSSLFRVT